MTAPVRRFLSFVRITAPPLPGLWCWNHTIVKISLSRIKDTPFLKSAVSILGTASVLPGGPRIGPPLLLQGYLFLTNYITKTQAVQSRRHFARSGSQKVRRK